MDNIEKAKIIVSLRTCALQKTQGFRFLRSFESKALSYWKSLLDRMDSHWHFSSPPQGKAYIGVIDGLNDYYRAIIREVNFSYDQNSLPAKNWIREKLSDLLQSPDARDLIRVPFAHRELIPWLIELGYGLGEVGLGGFPPIAKKGLQDHYGDYFPLPGEWGLTTKVLDRSHVEDVLSMMKDLYHEKPEHCWFFHHPGIIEREKERLLQEFPKGCSFGLFEGTDLKGYFSYPFKEKITPYGKECGVDIGFHKDLQGKRLSVFAYRFLLDRMIVDGVEFFKGGTANPAVLKLSAVMKRPVLWYDLKKVDLCPSQSRFSYCLDEIDDRSRV